MSKTEALDKLDNLITAAETRAAGWQDEEGNSCHCNHNWEWCEAPGCGEAYTLTEVRRGVELGMPGYLEKAQAA